MKLLLAVALGLHAASAHAKPAEKCTRLVYDKDGDAIAVPCGAKDAGKAPKRAAAKGRTTGSKTLEVLKEEPAAKKETADSASPDVGTASPEQVQLTDIVLKTPTGELDPALAGAFLKLDTDTLPKKLRSKARGKQFELNALIKVAQGKKMGSIRPIGADQCTPPKPKPEDIPMMTGFLGFVEVTEWGVAAAGSQTECTELDMQCQFSLHIVDMGPKAKPPRRYFFQEKDPMKTIVEMKEKNIDAKQTQFFGTGFLKCQH